MKNILLLLIISILMLTGCGKTSSERSKKEGTDNIITFSGELASKHEVTLFAPFESTLISIRPEGSILKKGDEIARFETEDIQDEISSASNEIRALKIDDEVDDINDQLKTIEYQNSIMLASLEIRLNKKKLDEIKISDSELKIYKKKIEFTEKKLKQLENQYKDMGALLKKGFVSKQEYNNKYKELENEKTDLERLRLELKLKKEPEIIKIKQAERKYNNSISKYAIKIKRFMNFKAISQMKKENFKKDLKSKMIQLNTYLDKMKKSVFIAPEDGILSYNSTWQGGSMKKVKKGSIVYGGFPFATLSRLGDYQVKINFSELYFPYLKKGKPISFKLLAYPNRDFHAKLTDISSIAVFEQWDIKKIRTISAKADFNAKDLTLSPGMTAFGYLGNKPYFDNKIDIDNWAGDTCTIKRKAFERKIEGIAEFYSPKSIYLSTESGGKIASMVEEGTFVKTDEVIAVLESDSLDKRIKNLELSLKQRSSEVSILRLKNQKELKNLQSQLKDSKKSLLISEIEYKNSLSPSDIDIKKQTLKIKKNENNKKILEKKEKSAKLMLDKGYTSYSDYIDKLNNLEENMISRIELEYALKNMKNCSNSLDAMNKKYAYLSKKLEYDKIVKEMELEKKQNELLLKKSILAYNKTLMEYNMQKKRKDALSFHSKISGYFQVLEHWNNSGGKEKYSKGDEIRGYNTFASIADVSSLLLKGYIPEPYLREVKKGQKARFYFSQNASKQYEAKLIKIIPFVNYENLSGDSTFKNFQVTLSPSGKSKRFQPGAQVNFEIILISKDNALCVPKTAVIFDEKKSFIINSSGKKIKITVTGENEEEYMISGNIKENMKIRDFNKNG